MIMHGMVYLMKSRSSTAQTKLGHRTKLSIQDARSEVDDEYGNGYECFAIYDLGTDNRDEIENLVKQIRYIISTAAGALESTQPEYYNISPDKAFSILEAIAILCDKKDKLVKFE